MTDGDSNTDLGLSNPEEYNPPNADLSMKLYTPQYVFGPHDVDVFSDPSVDNTARVALLQLDYSDGNLAPDLDVVHDATMTTLATHGDIGATWGLAHDTVNNDLYAAAYLKRHVGFGPSGPSAIYKIDLDNGNTISTFFTDGSNFGTDPHPPAGTSCTDHDGGSLDEFTCWLYDISDDSKTVSDSYNLQGGMAWGDLEITEDYKNLVGVNLHTKELYIINIATAAATKISIPNPSCTGGDAENWRPFATAVKDNKVYVGGVCSGETNQLRGDLHAYFYAYNLSSSSWENSSNSIFDFDFNEASGATWDGCWEDGLIQTIGIPRHRVIAPLQFINIISH